MTFCYAALNVRLQRIGVGILILLSVTSAPLRGDTVILAPAKDNTVYSENNDASNGAGSYMFAGMTNSGNLRRALIGFDVSGSIPAGSTINSVTLRLYMSRTQAGNQTVRLHRMFADWGEGTSNANSGDVATNNDATWKYRFYVVNDPPSAPPWTTPGGDYAVTASASTTVGGIGAYIWGSSAAMVSDVQTWLDSPGVKSGWIIIGNEAQSPTAKRFDTRETSQISRRPQLSIDFTPDPTAGACCFINGSCQVQSQAVCNSLNGSHQGEGTSCTPNPCAQPTGACCFTSGTCQTLAQSDCTTQSGAYQGDFTACMPQLCPVILTPFVDPLPIPPLATPISGAPGGAATYDMHMIQVQQQLHQDLPMTTLWTYEGMFPGPTILATRNVPVIVNWINDLRDEFNNPRTTHYLPVDPCPHGAVNEPKVVVHLHGGHVPAAFDGYPESTFLPGSSATYVYRNNQLPSLLWYHDHSIGITRLNVYMGLAGGYVITDAFEQSLNLPSGEYDIPLIIQDRTFNSDGSLYYSAAWAEHFFGDKMLVNGKVWPYFNVKQGKYRLRALNGCNSRTLTLSLSNGQTFQQIGTDGGLLPAPVVLNQVTLGPAERADLLFDFSTYPPGTEIVLANSADAPFPVGDPMHAIPNVMKFIVQNQIGFTGAIPASLRAIETLDPMDVVTTRELTLQKTTDPCTGSVWLINGMHWEHIHEQPVLGTTEIWSFINRSEISHPMHMHLIFFQVLGRQDFDIVLGQIVPIGSPVPPAPEEAGWKDTVMAHPNQITRVIARFEDYTGLYPYHCHILEHEDHEMMRQFEVIAPPGSIPAVSQWGGFIMMLLLFVVGAVVLRGRTPDRAS